MQKVVIDNQLEDGARKAMLIRATAAEEVLWTIEAYQRSHTSADAIEPETPAENSFDEKTRLDLFDTKVRYAQRLSGFRSELADMQIDLRERGFLSHGGELDNCFTAAILQLAEMNKAVEPRRLFQQSS